MSLGLGHTYFVRMIIYHYGSLDSCLKFMNENKPNSDSQWFELRPEVNVKKATCDMYQCSLVEMVK